MSKFFHSLRLCALALLCHLAAAQTSVITVSPAPLHQNVKRFGINLSGQTFYDSGQMMRNLLFRNPGFEGGTWQSILHCKHFGTTSCSDANPYTVWPDHFFDNAHVQVLSGPAMGANSVVTASHSAAPPLGYVLNFQPLDRTPRDDDFLLVRVDKPGDAAAGWWPNLTCGATLATETRDLAPDTTGHQALNVQASGPCQKADVTSSFDTFEGHSFVHLRGAYTLSFRAKPLGGANRIHLTIERLDTRHGLARFLDRTVNLTSGWHDYSIPVSANDKPDAVGSVRVNFGFESTSALLDDVSFAPAARSRDNPTAFREEVVSTLHDLHPGIIRYMDNGANFGSSLEDMIAPPFQRRRTGASTQEKLRDDVAIGLPEILELCEAIGAEPWISLPPGFSPFEMQHLVEYLSGPAASPYGSKRINHSKPWTEVFPTIHLELGNEQWNDRSFSGATINEPTAYGKRAASVFKAARTSQWFHARQYDLIAGSWFGVPWWTEQEARTLEGAADRLAVAPYLFSDFNNAADTESIFGPMFAQPEQLSTANGLMVQQRDTLARIAPGKKLAVYEVNLGTAVGSPEITQQQLDRTVPSLAGGLAVADHMLMMLRNLGITDQCFFALPEYQNGFTSQGGPHRTVPLWGAVVDMGGGTNLRRPSFLALQAVNAAMLRTMVSAKITGADPTWHQPASANDKIALPQAHMLQAYAFAEGSKRSLIVFNLSRTSALPVSLAGITPDGGVMHETILTSAHIDDNNETTEQVKPRSAIEQNFQPAATRNLAPFSMNVFTWTEGAPANAGAKPVAPSALRRSGRSARPAASGARTR